MAEAEIYPGMTASRYAEITAQLKASREATVAESGITPCCDKMLELIWDSDVWRCDNGVRFPYDGPYFDGEDARHVIAFCPYCGTKF